MGKPGFKLDIDGFAKQIEQLKKNIHAGVIDGFENSEQFLIERMTFYVTTEVYAAYFNFDQDNPNVYHRTYDLQDSIRAKVVSNAIYIYSEGVDYAERVLKGHDAIPYEFPFLGKNSTGDFRPARDWITPTKLEIIEHFKQDGTLKRIIVGAIQRRI